MSFLKTVDSPPIYVDLCIPVLLFYKMRTFLIKVKQYIFVTLHRHANRWHQALSELNRISGLINVD